ncbi:hypothetical protein [Asaia krungthepensis]|uniref:SMI1/KNR4 family protein n=1 Tax=Asaia krungthepensis NRIC 0535 TaxID=1307925 RepID=A0ABQ0Q3X3_9PROT|nr:hypothetical protein [Asaia krungthepensis]GBQ90231.1 hypothetical protein AA0535_1985 [Asaia krungthepensis NRIC 0535]
MSRNILIEKFDPEAEDGRGCFPLEDLRAALKGIGDPFYKEWSGGIETGEQTPYTMPDGRTDFASSTDTFLFSVKNGMIYGLDWDRPLGREGTVRALWHLIETHGFSLIDPSGGGDHPMLYVLSEACLEDVEQIWPDCRETGVHVFSGYEDFRSYFES